MLLYNFLVLSISLSSAAVLTGLSKTRADVLLADLLRLDKTIQGQITALQNFKHGISLSTSNHVIDMTIAFSATTTATTKSAQRIPDRAHGRRVQRRYEGYSGHYYRCTKRRDQLLQSYLTLQSERRVRRAALDTGG
jgi:hypothetical protein